MCHMSHNDGWSDDTERCNHVDLYNRGHAMIAEVDVQNTPWTTAEVFLVFALLLAITWMEIQPFLCPQLFYKVGIIGKARHGP